MKLNPDMVAARVVAGHTPTLAEAMAMATALIGGEPKSDIDFEAMSRCLDRDQENRIRSMPNTFSPHSLQARGCHIAAGSKIELGFELPLNEDGSIDAAEAERRLYYLRIGIWQMSEVARIAKEDSIPT